MSASIGRGRAAIGILRDLLASASQSRVGSLSHEFGFYRFRDSHHRNECWTEPPCGRRLCIVRDCTDTRQYYNVFEELGEWVREQREGYRLLCQLGEVATSRSEAVLAALPALYRTQCERLSVRRSTHGCRRTCTCMPTNAVMNRTIWSRWWVPSAPPR